jgi:2-C-methyl-D-erythritol 4-phosphate cytidylyltransferase
VQGDTVVDHVDRSTLRRLLLPTAVRVSVLRMVLAEGAPRVRPVLDALRHARYPAQLR